MTFVTPLIAKDLKRGDAAEQPSTCTLERKRERERCVLSSIIFHLIERLINRFFLLRAGRQVDEKQKINEISIRPAMLDQRLHLSNQNITIYQK
jgi:hypothetical protein